MSNNNKIKMYTDGACKGNPGIGGWGVYVLGKNDETDLNGFDINTTNNKMELTAVIEGLKILKNKSEVTIVTDSQYVKNGINQWIYKWKKNGWKTASKKPVKNKDLWKELDYLVREHIIDWEWVRGHSGNPGNERADLLANKGILEHLEKRSNFK
tara:strand:+ start:24 stop:488 length:465 start_codon:yes stop_codon:yes gene_type:complete